MMQYVYSKIFIKFEFQIKTKDPGLAGLGLHPRGCILRKCFFLMDYTLKPKVFI
jgi:hypothetical protein